MIHGRTIVKHKYIVFIIFAYFAFIISDVCFVMIAFSLDSRVVGFVHRETELLW